MNGIPAECSAHDTYFIPDPKTGLILSDNCCVVKPDNSVLYSIGENVATYKTDNFSAEEIETIVSLMTPQEREMYQQYSTGNISADKIRYEEIMGYASNNLVKEEYLKANDKKAFLRGLFEEGKFEILTCFLRNAVVRMSMDKMGYKYINVNDGCETSICIAQTARQKGIPGNPSNKGHYNSFEAACERIGGTWLGFIEALDNFDMDTVLAFYEPQLEYYLSHSNAPDMYKQYTDIYNEYHIDDIRYTKNSIREYNKHLDYMLRRNADVLQQKYIAADKKFKSSEFYKEFQQHLKKIRNNTQVQKDITAVFNNLQSDRE